LLVLKSAKTVIEDVAMRGTFEQEANLFLGLPHA